MGRAYAGILGYTVWILVVVRGLRHGQDAYAIMMTATLSLVTFALVGFIVGELAAKTVEDSVRARVAAEVEAHGEMGET